MKIKVYSLTVDGDNIPIETTVFGSMEELRTDLIAGIESFGIQHGRGPLPEANTMPLRQCDDTELVRQWEIMADGVCIIGQHEIEIAEEVHLIPGVMPQPANL